MLKNSNTFLTGPESAPLFPEIIFLHNREHFINKDIPISWPICYTFLCLLDFFKLALGTKQKHVEILIIKSFHTFIPASTVLQCPFRK